AIHSVCCPGLRTPHRMYSFAPYKGQSLHLLRQKQPMDFQTVSDNKWFLQHSRYGVPLPFESEETTAAWLRRCLHLETSKNYFRFHPKGCPSRNPQPQHKKEKTDRSQFHVNIESISKNQCPEPGIPHPH